MRLRDRLGIDAATAARATRLMELSLVGFLFVGLYAGNVGIAVNSALGLVVTQLPPLLERDYEMAMDAGLVLWITAAVFLHALGTVGLPGGASFYQSVWWWDHLTHLLSASVVTGASYATVRALEEHVPELQFPPKFVFALLVLVTLAFGVVWEVLEFAVGGLGSVLGAEAVLTQYGLADSMLDLVFDAVGGVVVAIWGTAYLTGVSDELGERLRRA
jgi:hypothetical protein